MKKTMKFLCILFLVSSLMIGCKSTPPSDSSNQNTTGNTQQQPTTEKALAVVDKNQPVQFDCMELKGIVKNLLEIEDEDVLISQMENLYELKLKGESVSSLKGLEYAENLYTLSIEDNTIDLGHFEALNNLPYLYHIFINKTSFILPIGMLQLEALERLTIQRSNLEKIDFLQNLVTLQHLSLPYNFLTDVSEIENLTNLNYLSLRDNPITSIEPLKNLSALQRISLVDTRVHDLTPIEGLTILEEINISFTDVTNLKPLEDLPNLISVTILLSHEEKHRVADQVDMLIKKGIDVDYTR